MAQSVWIAVPFNHQYKIVDVSSGPPKGRYSELDALALADNGPTAIIKAVDLANQSQRRITAITRFNMEILLIVD